MRLCRIRSKLSQCDLGRCGYCLIQPTEEQLCWPTGPRYSPHPFPILVRYGNCWELSMVLRSNGHGGLSIKEICEAAGVPPGWCRSTFQGNHVKRQFSTDLESLGLSHLLVLSYPTVGRSVFKPYPDCGWDGPSNEGS